MSGDEFESTWTASFRMCGANFVFFTELQRLKFPYHSSIIAACVATKAAQSDESPMSPV